MVDRPPRENKPLGDLDVAQPASKQDQDLEFTRRERRRIGDGATSWTTGDVTDPELAQAARDDPGRRECAEALQRGQRGAQVDLVAGSSASERCVIGTTEFVPH